MSQTTPPVDPCEIACVECGYDLSGTAVGSVCPECGSTVMNSITRKYTDRTSVSALICMILGVLSMASIAAIPLLGIVAIVWYFPAKREVQRGQYSAASMWMAKTGLVTGMVGIALILIVPLLFRNFR